MASLAQNLQNWRTVVAQIGIQRLFVLALLGVAVVTFLVFGALYLNRPSMEMLYTGLEKEDVTRIGAALGDIGIPFDVNAKGDAVLVPYGQTPRARMLLAERGLPRSETAGYELFDKMGSMGLTSFMQQITKVRALEGEIARSLQLLKGVKAARVHLVLGEESALRRLSSPPSASVILKFEGQDEMTTAQAARHLVASAVPSMTIEHVTVLSSDGTLLASESDGSFSTSGKMVDLEKNLSSTIKENIRHTLIPYLGLEHFQVSVTTQLNTDKKQTNETVFDPNSKVERSVRVVRESGLNQNSKSQKPTTVGQNVPGAETNGGDGDRSSEKTDRREELTNFEVNSKTVSTIKEGYQVEKLSVAVIVNRDKILKTLGKDTSPEALQNRLKEIESLVNSAAGLNKERGDQLTVTALSFDQDSANSLTELPGPNWQEQILGQLPGFVNAGTFLVVALLLILFGLRPVTKVLLAPPQPLLALGEESKTAAAAGGAASPSTQQSSLPGPQNQGEQALPHDEASLLPHLSQKMNNLPQKRLEQLVQFDEKQAATVLKQWIRA